MEVPDLCPGRTVAVKLASCVNWVAGRSIPAPCCPKACCRAAAHMRCDASFFNDVIAGDAN